MRITVTISTIIMLFALNCAAQTDKKQIREGNKLYSNKKFRESEVSYQKALKKDPKSFKAGFNLGDALYKQEKFDEASKQFTEVSAKSNDKTNSSKAFHNLGNSYLLQNKFDESINAYKNALRNNPTDLATKYNLAYAQAMKKKQEEQKQQDNKDQQNKDKQEQKQQQQPKEDKKKDDKQQQPKDQQMSKEDADRMLQALQEEEKDTQEKAKKIQAQQGKKNVEKDW